ncbi:MAG TPA: hypothetical protein VGK70_09715 [Thermoanaerobaculia bacterium]
MRFARMAVWAAICVSPVACGRASPRKGTAAAGLPRIPVIIRFQPPADGLLTDAQIDRYVRVRRAARGLRGTQGPPTKPLERTPQLRSDEETVRVVGVDPEEFVWVRTRIVEALVALDTSQLKSTAEATYARTIASLREAARSVKDRETLRRMEEQIAGLERERGTLKAGDKPPAAVAANARRVASRRAEIEALGP